MAWPGRGWPGVSHKATTKMKRQRPMSKLAKNLDFFFLGPHLRKVPDYFANPCRLFFPEIGRGFPCLSLCCHARCSCVALVPCHTRHNHTLHNYLFWIYQMIWRTSHDMCLVAFERFFVNLLWARHFAEIEHLGSLALPCPENFPQHFFDKAKGRRQEFWRDF